MTDWVRFKIVAGVLGALAALAFIASLNDPPRQIDPVPVVQATSFSPPTSKTARPMTKADENYYLESARHRAELTAKSREEIYPNEGPSPAEQLEGMIQAARDAGLDEATARQVGTDAMALCNGNPECLR